MCRGPPAATCPPSGARAGRSTAVEALQRPLGSQGQAPAPVRPIVQRSCTKAFLHSTAIHARIRRLHTERMAASAGRPHTTLMMASTSSSPRACATSRGRRSGGASLLRDVSQVNPVLPGHAALGWGTLPASMRHPRGLLFAAALRRDALTALCVAPRLLHHADQMQLVLHTLCFSRCCCIPHQLLLPS